MDKLQQLVKEFDDLLGEVQESVHALRSLIKESTEEDIEYEESDIHEKKP